MRTESDVLRDGDENGFPAVTASFRGWLPTVECACFGLGFSVSGLTTVECACFR